MVIKALTICQPYAWAIVNGAKSIEYRSWTTSYRGPLLIHAGSSFFEDAWEEFDADGIPDELDAGGIVGVATLVRVSKPICDPEADFEWHLADPRPLPFLRCKGRLGLWEPSLGQLRSLGLTG